MIPELEDCHPARTIRKINILRQSISGGRVEQGSTVEFLDEHPVQSGTAIRYLVCVKVWLDECIRE